MAAELSLSDLNGRFRFIERPFPLPGKCAVCGNVQTPVVDFGATVDGYGAVLICQLCVQQAFSLLVKVGVVEVPQPVPVEDYLAVSETIHDGIKSALGDIRILLDAYNDLSNRVSDEVSHGESEGSAGSSGEKPSGSEGTAGQTGNASGNKRPSRVSSSSTDGLGISGI